MIINSLKDMANIIMNNVLNSSSEDEDNQTQQYNIISNITDSVDILENDESSSK